MRIMVLSYFTSMFHEENVQTKIMQNPDNRVMEGTQVATMVTNIPTHSTLPKIPIQNIPCTFLSPRPGISSY